MEIKHSKFLKTILTILFVSTLFSCTKPFEGVNAILTNNYLKNKINVQIIDANPLATNPYPAGVLVTLTGPAVSQGLIYSDNGTAITVAKGDAVAIKNTVSLAVKPYTAISASKPILFTIFIEAPGYLSTSKDIVVNPTDALQYIDLKLIKITAPPAGVAIKQETITGINGGTLPNATIVTVPSVITNSLMPSATVSLNSGTVFKDVRGAVINSSAALNISVVNFSNNTSASVESIPGGINNVTTSTGAKTNFVLAGALDIKAFLGTTQIKTFTNPFNAKLYVPETSTTAVVYKANDILEIWSKDEGSSIWKKETDAVVTREVASGRLFVNFDVTHLSIWTVVTSQLSCANPLSINYSSTTDEINTHYITISTQGANSQILGSRKVSVKNGDIINFTLPQNTNYTIRLYEGSDASGPILQQVDANACTTIANLSYTVPVNRPVLYFNLETACSNGVFRYTGPIDYKVNGTNIWQTFTPSNNGTLTTNLLEWDKTYNFRIIYKGAEFIRTRTVLKTEFREVGNKWEYFGKDPNVKQTFFNSPTACN